MKISIGLIVILTMLLSMILVKEGTQVIQEKQQKEKEIIWQITK